MNKVQRGDALLAKLASSKIINECSVSALKQALDPFHDTQLSKLSGWPDANTAPSIVRCIKQTQVFSLPGGTGLLAWDLHVANWPWANATPYSSTMFTRSNQVIGNSTSNFASYTTTGAVLGGVQAWYTGPGANLNPLGATNVLGTLDLGPGFASGSSRVIGCGFECVDVTNTLHKQGQVGVYRLAEPSMQTSTFQYGGVPNYPQGQIIRTLPQNFKQLMLIPGSRQWEAKDGCYLVVPFWSEENPARIPNYVQPIIPFDGGVEDQITSWSGGGLPQNTGLVGIPALTNLFGTGAWPATNIFSVPAMFHAPQHQAGCIFAGLHPEAQIAVTVIYYVEEFPGMAQSDLLTLATPSSSFDPVALEIMTQAFMTLPVGVPAGYNGLGDWFAMAIKAAGSVIAPIALAMGQPHIAALAGASAAVASQYLTSPSPQSQRFATNLPSVPRNLGPPPPLPPRQAPALPARNTSSYVAAEQAVLKRQRKKEKKARKRALQAQAALAGRR